MQANFRASIHIALRALVATKVVKATNTSGLKMLILVLLEEESRHRELNNFEAINVLNAVSRTRLFYKEISTAVPRHEYKYKLVRKIKMNPASFTYNMEIKNGMVTFNHFKITTGGKK
jgi:hypothetical protein